ncbi:11493_t:CDS:2, partial [Ambispora leptoticha]
MSSKDDNRRNDIKNNHPSFFSIAKAKDCGMTDPIDLAHIQERVIEIVKEHRNGVILSEIPKLYFDKYDRALVYQGKLSVALPENIREIKLEQ